MPPPLSLQDIIEAGEWDLEGLSKVAGERKILTYVSRTKVFHWVQYAMPMAACVFVCLFVCLFSLSVCLSVCMFVCLFVCLSVCLSV